MDWQDLGRKIAALGAPLLGGVVAGPAGAKVGGLLASALGVRDEDQPDAIARAIDQDPAAGARLVELQLTHRQRLEELRLQATQIHLADVQSARARNVAVAQATGRPEWFLYGLATAIVVMFGAIVAILVYQEVPAAASSVLYVMLGSLATAFTTVVSFFFGSSKGSAKKTDAMQRELDKKGA